MPVDRNDSRQAADLGGMDALAAAAREGSSIRTQAVIGMAASTASKWSSDGLGAGTALAEGKADRIASGPSPRESINNAVFYEQNLEARAGIEPACKDLQSSA